MKRLFGVQWMRGWIIAVFSLFCLLPAQKGYAQGTQTPILSIADVGVESVTFATNRITLGSKLNVGNLLQQLKDQGVFPESAGVAVVDGHGDTLENGILTAGSEFPRFIINGLVSNVRYPETGTFTIDNSHLNEDPANPSNGCSYTGTKSFALRIKQALSLQFNNVRPTSVEVSFSSLKATQVNLTELIDDLRVADGQERSAFSLVAIENTQIANNDSGEALRVNVVQEGVSSIRIEGLLPHTAYSVDIADLADLGWSGHSFEGAFSDSFTTPQTLNLTVGEVTTDSVEVRLGNLLTGTIFQTSSFEILLLANGVSGATIVAGTDVERVAPGNPQFRVTGANPSIEIRGLNQGTDYSFTVPYSSFDYNTGVTHYRFVQGANSPDSLTVSTVSEDPISARQTLVSGVLPCSEVTFPADVLQYRNRYVGDQVTRLVYNNSDSAVSMVTPQYQVQIPARAEVAVLSCGANGVQIAAVNGQAVNVPLEDPNGEFRFNISIENFNDVTLEDSDSEFRVIAPLSQLNWSRPVGVTASKALNLGIGETNRFAVQFPAGAFTEGEGVNVDVSQEPTAVTTEAIWYPVSGIPSLQLQATSDSFVSFDVQPKASVTMTFPIPEDMTEEAVANLQVAYYNESNGQWQTDGISVQSVNFADKTVTAVTTHFTEFALVQSLADQSLVAGKTLYPNPAHERIRFANFDSSRVVRIYTLQGELVQKIDLSNGDGEWDLRNRSGRTVASGVYFAHFDGEDKIKKIAVER